MSGLIQPSPGTHHSCDASGRGLRGESFFRPDQFGSVHPLVLRMGMLPADIGHASGADEIIRAIHEEHPQVQVSPHENAIMLSLAAWYSLE